MTQFTIMRKILLSTVSTIYPVLTIYSYFVFVGKYCIQVKQFDTALVLILFLIYHFLLIYSLIFYMRILAIDDTSTANRFKGKGLDSQKIVKRYFNHFIYQEIEEKQKHMLKKCHICSTYKPPRTHHCSICNKCFLKSDHHSEYLGVCIAFYNYKFFYLFHISNLLYSLFVDVVLLFVVLTEKDLTSNPLSHFLVTLSLLLLEFLYSLQKVIEHGFLISKNETLIEANALDAFYRGDQGFLYIFQEGLLISTEDVFDRAQMTPYNLGTMENWVQIFGPPGIYSILPISTSIGDGINFQKR